MPDGCDGEPYLTTEEVAEILRTKPGTVRFWRTKGRGPVGAKIGRRWLYRRADVDAWYDAQKRPPASE